MPKPTEPLVVMNFLVDPELGRKIAAEAKRLHGTKSQVGRLALDRYFRLTETERTG